MLRHGQAFQQSTLLETQLMLCIDALPAWLLLCQELMTAQLVQWMACITETPA